MNKGIPVTIILFVGSWLLLCSIAPILVKTGIKEDLTPGATIFDTTNLFKLFTNKYVVTGLLLYVLATFMWLVALSRLDVSILSPLGSLAFVLTAIFALVFLGERIGTARWAGIGLIIIGTFLLFRS